MGLVVCGKENEISLPISICESTEERPYEERPCENTARKEGLFSRNTVLARNQKCRHIILDCQASRTERNKFLLSKTQFMAARPASMCQAQSYVPHRYCPIYVYITKLRD